MLVPAVSCLVSVLSAVSTLTIEIPRFLCSLSTATLACVTFFASLATFLALGELSFPFVPFLDKASTSIGSSSCVFAFDVVLKMRLLLK